MDRSSPLDRQLTQLESEIKRLEAEYTMFFAGRLPKPPVETRARVVALVKQYDRAHIQNYGDRFRFSTLQARFAALTRLWDRTIREKEEGRARPLSTRGET
ncbi:MAG: hypothetical protein ABJA98_16270 [Acidobacteriota bacterium]